jgi:adenylosuccinate synthase
MTVTAVVGAQWGDEAKGKFVDLLAEEARIVARFNGGDNAGHTVVNEYGTFKLRLTPTGFSNPTALCVIGPGVVVNLETLRTELEMIESRGLPLRDRLWISPRCHVVMPYHPLLESIYEEAKGAGRTGTTRRGMGPVYADKVSYNGIRLFDLLVPDQFAARLRVQLDLKNRIITAFGQPALDFQQVYEEKLDQVEAVRSSVREAYGMIQQALADGDNILLEGAQGALLDNTWGTYPYTTASIVTAGGASSGLGLAPQQIQQVIGVAKAYTTRVGAGPFPTELNDEVGQVLLDQGREYGTVTGRPRRCGWFDANLVRFTAQINGCTGLALTKLDVLDTLPVLKICTGYRLPDESGPEGCHHYWEGDAEWLGQVQPCYIELPGWEQPTTQARHYEALPPHAQRYIATIEELVGTPVSYVSVGPEREATIRR